MEADIPYHLGGMKMNKIYEKIYEFENFISSQECDLIIKNIECVDESNWHNGSHGKVLNKHQVEIEELREKITKKIKSIFVSYSRILGENTNIQKISVSDGSMSFHVDNVYDTDVKYGMVLYYNSDFSGGELEYPDLNIVYKPKSGSLLIHDANYSHGVRPVQSGIRYISTYFVEGTQDVPVIINLEHLNEN